jgi:hypothetical protein
MVEYEDDWAVARNMLEANDLDMTEINAQSKPYNGYDQLPYHSGHLLHRLSVDHDKVGFSSLTISDRIRPGKKVGYGSRS